MGERATPSQNCYPTPQPRRGGSLALLSLVSVALALLMNCVPFPLAIAHGQSTEGADSSREQSVGQIHGRTFLDTNANGRFDPTEYALQDIKIYAYNNQNKLAVPPARSGADGAYIISPLMPDETASTDAWKKVRLEFVIPERLSYLQPGASAEGSATTVVFASAGDENVNVGFNNPASYCQPNPAVITSCFLSGPHDGPNSAGTALVSFPAMATGAHSGYVNSQSSADGASPSTDSGRLPNATIRPLATHNEIGSVYGLAYQRTTGLIYAAAFQKRFSDFGPGGPDAIYQLDKQGNLLAEIHLADLVQADLFTPAAHDFRIAAGELSPRDELSYSLSGKNAFGDLEISDDQQSLYVVNLWDRKLYAIDISSADLNQGNLAQGSLSDERAASAKSGLDAADLNVTDLVMRFAQSRAWEYQKPQNPIGRSARPKKEINLLRQWPTPDECGSSEHRPMALAWHKNRLWIGSVCEDATMAYVHSLDPNENQFNLEVGIPLTYPREPILSLDDSIPALATWTPWDDSPTNFAYAWENGNSSEIGQPQPLLSDIVFDGPHMILGLRDRFGDQSGYRRLHVPNDSSTNARPADRLYSGDAVGDILRICWADGRWVPENDGSGDCRAMPGEIGPRPASGLNGGEYYYWDFYPKSGANRWNPNQNVEHFEVSQGGLLQLPNTPWVMTTAMDPFVAFSAGILRLDNQSGQRVGIGQNDVAATATDLDPGGFTLYTSTAEPSTFGKASGLGDLEALCALAPLEIGNRVWRDSNANGVQDPAEDGIPNVQLALFRNGVLMGTAVTNHNGEYLFGGVADTNLLENAVLSPYETYQIRIALADEALPQPPQVSVQQADTEADALDDNVSRRHVHDNNGDSGDLVVGFSTAMVRTQGPGANNHTIDFGFYSLADLETLEDEEFFEIQANPNAVWTVFQDEE